ncbi:MAG TPA: oligopeptide transporter, OPT family [Myxococcota bacterium]|nr:oligopeptide transporter, OPT family [Myxococcota bacterium]HRY93390.1 oligopeptide transporter, OPT family [Myxococcota bacterium]HSA20378.1 oligopeptide transporter, OPT family [Myxococcota bacterium]
MHSPSPSPGSKLLPANAYTRLQPGETYQPIVPAGDGRAEVTPWSIGLGLIMVVVFTGACAYMALRAGNAIEASIPIAILAIFFGKMKKIRSTILENVMVQSVGQAAGVVAAGATFVIPALYINEQPVAWWHIFLATGIGGCLGVALIIPLRKYFVKDLHGELPFPEATAINEILVTGESAAAGAGKILLIAFGLGALFDFSVETLNLWNAGLSTSFLPAGIGEAMRGVRLEVQLAGIAALFGLGYIIGIKYASIIAAGSVLSMLVLVPLVYLFGKGLAEFDFAGKSFQISELSAGAIFSAFVKPIGIGAIAVSGLIGILRMGKIVASSVSLGFKGLSRRGEVAVDERTQRDLSPGKVLLLQLGLALLMGVLFLVVSLVTPMDATGASYPASDALLFAVVGMVVGFLLSFLFTPVAAQAIAIVGTNPVSGMTLITVALSIGAMLLTGLKGNAGLIIALIIGTAVCTALSTSGALITDFKIGYWIGSTPRNQERWKFLGMAVAALVIAFIIPLMDSAYHFLVTTPEGLKISNEAVLPAPQANMIAAVSKGLMSDPASQPWLLYGLGGIVAVLLFMAGVPMLAFALGMYLPISINMAVLAGAFCAWLISRTGGRPEVRAARAEQGTLIASGLMAGAAIFGILGAVLRLAPIGAPIQHLSVGKDFTVEAVVDAKFQCGKHTCEELQLPAGKECNENLRELEFVEDASCRPVLGADGKPQPRHPWYVGGLGQGLGLGMLVLLGLVCFLLARLGARWQLAAAPPGAGPPEGKP